MLTQEENKALTSIMPGTPMGELMRRYWHPIAAAAELDDKATKPVRILGEDLVLYKDKSGTIGLIERFCPHRRVDLSYGIPEDNGLRCMYHGWMMDETGQCIEQPFEETVRPDGRFKEKVKIAGYPVEELGGLLFAYLGPQPAPLLPKWETFAWEDGWCDIGLVNLPVNWLQCMEKSMDPVHLEWLHGYWGVRQQQDKAVKLGLAEADTFPTVPRKHHKIGFDIFDYGLIKRRVVEGTTEEDHDWSVGHPVLFPNILFVGSVVNCNLQYRVPVDDENTMHITWFFYRAAEGSQPPIQERIPYWYVNLYEPNGELIPDLVNHQDFVAWITQGSNAEREKEKLGESDRGIILYRKVLKEQAEIVADGADPMGVVRDPKVNERIDLPLERWQALSDVSWATRYMPLQQGESNEMVESIEKVLSTWVGAKPWTESHASLNQ